MNFLNRLFSLLLMFEHFHLNIKLFTSKKSNDNNVIIFSYNFGIDYLTLLKKSIGFYFLSLLDIIGVDLTKLKNYNLFFNIQN